VKRRFPSPLEGKSIPVDTWKIKVPMSGAVRTPPQNNFPIPPLALSKAKVKKIMTSGRGGGHDLEKIQI
jgi:hypothetical protein